MTEERKSTEIERHCIGRDGIFEFLIDSKEHGKYAWSQDELISSIRKAAKCDKKDDREFMLSLIDTISRLDESANELRLRFNTVNNALTKINKSLQENEEAKLLTK